MGIGLAATILTAGIAWGAIGLNVSSHTDDIANLRIFANELQKSISDANTNSRDLAELKERVREMRRELGGSTTNSRDIEDLKGVISEMRREISDIRAGQLVGQSERLAMGKSIDRIVALLNLRAPTLRSKSKSSTPGL
jgi:predicted RNase H-like nuclease (RuvC/YqgF family)